MSDSETRVYENFDTSPQDWYMYMPECGVRVGYLRDVKSAPPISTECCALSSCATQHVHTLQNVSLRTAHRIMTDMI